jgi:hypothetical protein
MLFDLYLDPTEKSNLSETPSYETIRRDLNDRLQTWMEATGDPLLRGEVPKPTGAIVGDVSMINPRELSGRL